MAQDTTFTVQDYDIKVENSKMFVNDSGKIIYQRNFNNPFCFSIDLDSDGIDEVVVNDSEEKDGLSYYYVYVFNCADQFSLTDSVYSGLKEPYFIDSDEIENFVLVTGSPDFDSLYNPELETAFSPLICWSYVDASLSIVNDQLYDIFINENQKNIEVISAIYNEKGKSCQATELVKSVIASTYANYIYADEKATAERSLEQFYYCSDLANFKKIIEELL